MFMNRYVNIGLACAYARRFLGARGRTVGRKRSRDGQAAKRRRRPVESVNLGTVRIPRAVKANGEALAAGTYQVRVTETPGIAAGSRTDAAIRAMGGVPQGGKVVAREVVTSYPNSDIKQVAEMKPPPPADRAPRCSRVATTCGCGSTAAAIIT